MGRIAPDDFELVRAPVPKASPGEAVVRNLYLSLDPTNRIWVEDVEQYMPPRYDRMLWIVEPVMPAPYPSG